MEVKEKGRNRTFLLALLVLLVLSVHIVTTIKIVTASEAADVAYILKRERSAKPEILDVFSDLGLSVDLIEDKNVMDFNLSKYRLLFIDDVVLRKTRDLPIYNYPSVIMNGYHGKEWGLVKNFGVSRLASTEPLKVIYQSNITQVYTQARFSAGGVSIPYYYLSNENKAEDIQKLAGTYTGDNRDLGDVIAVAPVGTRLTNGRISGGKLCFYGIAETDFWTEEARDLFEDCVSFVAMECASNADCPSQETGPRYCQNNDVYQNIEQFHCENPGTVQSQCVDDLISQKIEECDDGNAYTEDVCSNGACQHNPLECIQASDCGTDGWINAPVCVGNNVHQNYLTFSCINNMCSNQTNQLLNQTCTEGCFNGACVEITCYNNAECGTNGFIGDEFCQGDDVYRNYQNFLCNNPGTINSSCSSNSNPQLVEQCSGTCQDGNCIDIACSTDADCDDQDTGTEDTCHNAGTPASYCTNEPIVCFRNADCGINGYTGNFYCQSDNVFRNFQSHICFNAGTASSYCASNITQILNTICPDSCYLGGCVDITCYNNADCDDSLAYTEDICLLPGTILSSCTHGDITCIQDSDCGADMFIGDTYCTGDDVFRDFKAYDCKNEGTTSSYCSSNITGNFLESCAYVCANGDCIRCNDNSDCDDGDSSTYDICRFSGTPESYCGHEHIECSTDIECGIDGFVGLPFCQGDDLYQNNRTFDCKNEGTPGSYCDDDSNPQLIEECDFGCAGNQCLPGIHDVALIDFTNSTGGIRLEVNGTDILGNPAQLICNQDYQVLIKVENQGNFFENVTFNGSIDGLLFNHTSIPNFAPGNVSGEKQKTVNFNLLAGLYNIIVNAIIPVDDDLSDNQATRQVEIICHECETNADCNDGNPCTQDVCEPDYTCTNENKPDLTPCGSFIDCPASYCATPFWFLYPSDGQGYCQAGSCIEHDCTLIDSFCELSCGAECEDDGDCSDTCDGNNRLYNGNCNLGGCECSYDSCEEDTLVQDYPQLRQSNGLANININNNGYLILKGPNHDDLKIILHKNGGGQQIIYCHDLFDECPSGCQDNDDICVYDRNGALLYQDNFLTGNIPRTRVDVQAGEWLSLGIEWDSHWNAGLEIWTPGTCPDSSDLCH